MVGEGVTGETGEGGPTEEPSATGEGALKKKRKKKKKKAAENSAAAQDGGSTS